MKTKTVIKLKCVDGYKQDPPDNDFHLTPCLTWGYYFHAHLGWARGLFIEWGHWAIGVAAYTVILKEGQAD